MKKLKTSFEKLYKNYQEDVQLFKQRVEHWKRRGYEKSYQQGSALLIEAERCIQLLKTDAGSDKETYKTTLKLFKKTYKNLSEITKPLWRQWVEAVLVALFFAMILRNFLFGLYHVPSGSAEPTILVGDRIWGNKMAYYFQKPQRGDLVIFDNPEFSYNTTNILAYWWQRYVGIGVPFLGMENGPDNWVKRVVAGPGDVIEGRVEDGKTVIYLNGKILDEPYVNTYPLIRLTKTTGFVDADFFGPFAVPSFLRFMHKHVRYSYDPSKLLSQQPFYCMTEDEALKDFETSRYVLDFSRSPSYRSDTLSKSCVDVFGPFTVPACKYWVMGDSRKNSRDSRFWLFLDEKLIHGRASFIIWSLDSEESFWFFDFIKHPIDFWTKHVRWNRILKEFSKYNSATN